MRLVLCGMLAVALSGCALHRTKSAPSLTAAESVGLPAAEARPGDALEAFIAQVRKRASEARSARVPAATIEGQDPRLGVALTLATTQPSPEAYRAVAREYRRLGVADRASDYLHKALVLDRRDWATYDALARVWRDSGALSLALGDAHRAVFFAPRSPIARNTLGTILQGLGQRKKAREQYEAALQFDPAASYALNNLCYGWILDGNTSKATRACEQALNLNPALVAARNNLGILYAAGGDLVSARTAFAYSGDQAAASYNLGIMYLARREYRKAASAFSDAQQVRPTRQTAARVRQAMALSAAGGNE